MFNRCVQPTGRRRDSLQSPRVKVGKMASDRRARGNSFQIFGDTMHSRITNTQPFFLSNARDNVGLSGHGTPLGFSLSHARDTAGSSRHGTPLGFSSSYAREMLIL
ncbi:hypothetical protein ACH5RR_015793 [Cinchona calisaya]|uniref:Uncharacterized protein n=1 Tax=Cinchona calisaya TaxID=153742 RepID=A0ABD2ZU68_9GENT